MKLFFLVVSDFESEVKTMPTVKDTWL